MRQLAFVLSALMLLVSATAAEPEDSPAPVILIYSPNAPGYGQALARIIEEDGGFEGARIRTCNELVDFKVTMLFPDVKVGLVTLLTDTGEDLNRTLEWFFRSGGGLLGMGFAGIWSASRNASQDVFPIFGNMYWTGQYDPGARRFVIEFIKEQEDEISQGISSFSIPQHKFVLSYNKSTESYEERWAKSGEFKVLFREASTGAPLMVKYRDQGVSISFATFGGDDVQKSPSYHGLFVNRSEFQTLLTNSLYWIWTSEGKFEEGLARAQQYYRDRADHIDSLRQASEKRERAAARARLSRNVAAIAGGCIGCAGVYWLTFRRKVAES